MNIALFGTSADPPTVGHAVILQYLTAQFDYVVVWAADNPFKSQQTPLADRHQMLQLLAEDAQLAPSRLQIHPELSYSRTWTTLDKAQETWPDAQFTLVIGADLVPQITHWYRATELLQRLRLLVIPRQGYELAEADLQSIRQLGTPITIAQVTPPKASSSEYRKQGRRSSPYLTPKVQTYIEREQLYAWQVDSQKPTVVQS